jgi:alkylation response protein AidB-like acyl-CoA dehydrogenase
MRFAFTEEQEELRAMARAFLADHSAPEQVRAAMASELGHDPAVWKRIGAELGWPAVIVPEVHGGLGLTWVELIALLEVCGESLLCSPFFASLALGANALLLAASDAQLAAHLPAIAEGQTRATLAHAERAGRWDSDGVEAVFRRDGDGWLLSGAKRHVLDGHCADLLVVSAREPGSDGERGISLFAVPGDAKGVERRQLSTMDRTRRLAAIELRDVRLPADALLGEPGAAWPALERALDRAAIALAAEQVGGAQRCLDAAVAYGKERVQFGRPIGSFQAIKHRCADMMVRVETARSAAYYAACLAADEGPDLSRAASMAKAWCSDAFFACAADSLQIHGGVGFTWEYDVHLYFKRAKSTESFLGDPAFHRERVARRIGL